MEIINHSKQEVILRLLMGYKIKERVKKIMSAVFCIAEEEIKSNSSADTITTWDSLKHMNLVVALEEEFDVEFSDNEIIELINTQLIIEVLREKLGDNQ